MELNNLVRYGTGIFANRCAVSGLFESFTEIYYVADAGVIPPNLFPMDIGSLYRNHQLSSVTNAQSESSCLNHLHYLGDWGYFLESDKK